MNRRRLNDLLLNLAELVDLAQIDEFLSSHPELLCRDAVIATIDLQDEALRELRRGDLYILTAVQQLIEARLGSGDPAANEQYDDTFASEEEFQASVRLVTNFVSTTTLSDARKLLNQNSELLSDRTIKILKGFVDSARSDGETATAALLEESYALLKRSREVGIRNTFVEKAYKDDEIIPSLRTVFANHEQRMRRLFDEFYDIMKANTEADLSNVIDRDLDLLSNESDILVRTLIRTSRAEADSGAERRFLYVHDKLTDFRDQATTPRQPDRIRHPISGQFPSTHMPSQLPRLLDDAIARGDVEAEIRLSRACLEADVLTDRGKAMVQRKLGVVLLTIGQSDVIDEAIELLDRTTAFYTKASYPEDWAQLNAYLALALSKRSVGNLADNYERMTAHVAAALSVNLKPEALALTEMNIATAFGNLLYGDRAENLEESLRHYKSAEQSMVNKESVSVREHIESCESFVIQEWWPDSRRVTDVDGEEPRTL